MNANSLIEWSNKHNAKNQTIEGFWGCFNKWRSEDRSDYLNTFHGKIYDEFITVKESQIYLKFSFDMEEAFIFYSVNIYYLDKPIGKYEMEFFLNGEIADDYLDFDNFKDKILKVKQNITIARKAIKEDVQLSTISKITEIDEASLKIIKEKYC